MAYSQNAVSNALDDLEHSYEGWFDFPEGVVYLELMDVDQLGGRTLNIGSIATDEDYYGQDVFVPYTQLFEEAAYLRGYAAIVFDQVHGDLYRSLKGQGYHDIHELALLLPDRSADELLQLFYQPMTVYKLLT